MSTKTSPDYSQEDGLVGEDITTQYLSGTLDPLFQPGGELAALGVQRLVVDVSAIGVQRLVVDVSAIGKGITTADVTAVTINANATNSYNIQSSGLIIVDKNLTKQSVVKVIISGVEYTVTVN